MRLATYNVNSVRMRLDIVHNFLKLNKPDIFGMQEIKVETSQFPLQRSAEWDYEMLVNGQKGYHGVAIFSKPKSVSSLLAADFENGQARFSYGEYSTELGPLHFFNCYFPQGESRKHAIKFPYKINFYNGFINHLKKNFKSTDLVFVCGDFNIAPADIDIGIGEVNIKRWLSSGKCSFLPEERELLSELMSFGLYDCYRVVNPTDTTMSWFDFRSRGFEDKPKRGLRIDYGLCTKPLLERLVSAQIDHDTRALPKTSDHCPVIFDFELAFSKK